MTDQKTRVVVEGGDIAAKNLADLKRQLVEGLDIMTVLSSLANGLEQEHKNRDDMPTAAKKRWDEIIDLMYHFDPDAGPGSGSETPPETNPLTLIERLRKEGLVSKTDAAALRANFNERVRDAIGVELDEKQVQAVFTLLQSYSIGRETGHIPQRAPGARADG